MSSPAQELVTLDQVKAHLKLPLEVSAEDDDLEMKLWAAQELVLDYLKNRIDDTEYVWADTVDGWDIDTVPSRVQAAILYQTAELWRFRGDDEGRDDRRPMGTLCPVVIALLHRLRDPSLA